MRQLIGGSPRFRPLRQVAVVLGLVALTSCIPKFGTVSGPVTSGVLTPDGSDAYVYGSQGESITISAPETNQGGNLRDFYWDPTAVFYADQESCQRWDSVMDLSTAERVASFPRIDGWQPGIGLRIAPTEQGNGLRGISVDQNVWAFQLWELMVLVWDTTQDPPFHGVTSIDISPVVGSLSGGGHLARPPWNICAQAFGNQVRVKVWLGDDPEPDWTDPTHVFLETLPDGWDFAGHPGGYVGHLAPGGVQQVTPLRSGALMPDGSPPVAPTPSTTTSP